MALIVGLLEVMNVEERDDSRGQGAVSTLRGSHKCCSRHFEKMKSNKK